MSTTKKYPDIITGWGMRRILSDWVCEKKNIENPDDPHDDYSDLAMRIDECIERIEEEFDAKFDWPRLNGTAQ